MSGESDSKFYLQFYLQMLIASDSGVVRLFVSEGAQNKKWHTFGGGGGGAPSPPNHPLYFWNIQENSYP